MTVPEKDSPSSSDAANASAKTAEAVPAGATMHDWPEDFPHENGMYMCKCQCGATFYGHKRRSVCKVCAAAPDPNSELWHVTVSVGNKDVLTIGNNYLCGRDDVERYRARILACAEQLQRFLDGDVKSASAVEARQQIAESGEDKDYPRETIARADQTEPNSDYWQTAYHLADALRRHLAVRPA